MRARVVHLRSSRQTSYLFFLIPDFFIFTLTYIFHVHILSYAQFFSDPLLFSMLHHVLHVVSITFISSIVTLPRCTASPHNNYQLRIRIDEEVAGSE